MKDEEFDVILEAILKQKRHSSKGDELDDFVNEALARFNIGQLDIIGNVLRTIARAYYGKARADILDDMESIRDNYVLHLKKAAKVAREEIDRNPDDPFKNGRFLSHLMNIIDAEYRLIFGVMRRRNPLDILNRGGWATLNQRNPEDLLNYYKFKRRPILYRICEANIVFKIPYQPENRERYIAYVLRKMPLADRDTISMYYTLWGTEVGIETSPTGLIEDSQLWADFVSVLEQELEERIAEEDKLWSQ